MWENKNQVGITIIESFGPGVAIEMTSQLWIERKWTDNQDRYWTDTYRRPCQQLQSLLIPLESDPPSFYYMRLCLSFTIISDVIRPFFPNFIGVMSFFSRGGAPIVVLFQHNGWQWRRAFTAAHKSYSFDSREVNALPALARGFLFFFFLAGNSIITRWPVANLSLKECWGFFPAPFVVSSCRRVRSLCGCPIFSLFIENPVERFVACVLFSMEVTQHLDIFRLDCTSTIPSSLLEFDSSGSDESYRTLLLLLLLLQVHFNS